MISFREFIAPLFAAPAPGRGTLFLWKRNFLYFKKTFLVSVFWLVLEPLLYLMAVGYGIGGMVDQIEGLSYPRYFAPAMILTSGVFISFFEATYGTFTRLSSQKTFQSVLHTPISPDEIAVGELLWASSKGTLSSISVFFICLLLNLVDFQGAAIGFVVIALLNWLFAAIGLWVTTTVKTYDGFIFSTSGFLIPISLFSGTYFSVASYPQIVQKIIWLSPMTHAVTIVRAVLNGNYYSEMFLSIAFLFIACVVMTNMATYRFIKKIFY